MLIVDKNNVNKIKNVTKELKQVSGTLFYKQRLFFFSTQPQCCLIFSMNWTSNIAKVLLNTYKHSRTETLSIFTILVHVQKQLS